MPPKQIKKFAVMLDYSNGRFGVGFELSETEKPGLYVGSALEAMAIADLLRNSQYATFDEERRAIETNFRPTGEAMKEWPDLNKPEPYVSTSSSGGMDETLKRLDRGKEGEE